jgi:plasmid stabilization system protein ParE
VTVTVRIRETAQRDIDEAARWYESQHLGLGNAFLDELLTTSTRISEAPLAFPEVGRSARRAMLRRFPFAIYYRLATDSAVVIAVMHGSRDPRRWRQRT